MEKIHNEGTKATKAKRSESRGAGRAALRAVGRQPASRPARGVSFVRLRFLRFFVVNPFSSSAPKGRELAIVEPVL